MIKPKIMAIPNIRVGAGKKPVKVSKIESKMIATEAKRRMPGSKY